jgi:V8-like Glu-specific endopeptidase
MTEARRVTGPTPKEGKTAAPKIPAAIPEDNTDDLEREHLSLEQQRLRLERQKLAIESRLKRQELSARQGKTWKELFANPLTLAIVGGFVTLMTTIVSNHYTQTANIAAEELRARLARESSQQELQAELIKKFVESPKTETVRENLRFLVDAGLLPDYAKNIQSYLVANPETAPQVGQAGVVRGIVGSDERVSFDTMDPTVQAKFGGEGSIRVSVGGGGGQYICTGFLVAPDVLVTANYCLLGSGSIPKASEATFIALPSDPLSKEAKPIPLDLSRLVVVETSPGAEGVAVVALKPPIANNPSYLPLNSETPMLGEGFSMAFWAADRAAWLYSAGPDCRTMQIEERELRHLCDTGGGSSGAPLIDSKGTVVGVHVGIAPDGKRALRADVIRNDPGVLKVFGQLPRTWGRQ